MSVDPATFPPRLIVLDVDGTLVDSLPDIAASVNRLRARHGGEPRSAAEVRAAIGEGSRRLLERTAGDLPAARASFEALLAEFKEVYVEESVRAPRLYPGAAPFLAAARRVAYLAILTNKPREITGPLLARLALDGAFARVVSPADARAVKPDPAALLELLADLAIAPAEAVVVGDSVHDFAAGRAAGAFTVGMRGGYGPTGNPEPHAWVDDFSGLAELLGIDAR